MKELEFVIWWLKNWSWKWQNVTLCTSETHTETGKKKSKKMLEKRPRKNLSHNETGVGSFFPPFFPLVSFSNILMTVNGFTKLDIKNGR